MNRPRSLTVDTRANEGTRWSSTNWMSADLARITSLTGPVPVNHIKERLPTYMGFNAWLEATVSPETHEWIMGNEGAFHMSLAAYINLARHQAFTKKTHINREAQPAESTTNV